MLTSILSVLAYSASARGLGMGLPTSIENQLAQLHAHAGLVPIPSESAKYEKSEKYEKYVSSKPGLAPPTLPPRWTATVSAGLPQQWSMDTGEKRMTVGQKVKMPVAPGEFVGTPKEWINSTTFLAQDWGGINLNGETLDGSSLSTLRFKDIFAWLPFAKYYGNVTVNGTELQNWTYFSTAITLSLLVDIKNTPVIFSEIFPPSSAAPTGVQIQFVFTDFKRDATIPGTWDTLNITEYTHPPVCDPVPAQTKTVAAYIFHPKNEFNISQQDIGDVVGDVFFTCTDVMSGQPQSVDHEYAWITWYELEVLPRWGQYLNCNGYNPSVCYGAESFYVGHEAAQGLGLPAGGQCEENPLTGEWWSLPLGGKCGDSQTPSEGVCSWKASRIKTIDGECLFKRDGKEVFKTACVVDRRAPFAGAQKLFLAAFASEDPAQGGCPAL